MFDFLLKEIANKFGLGNKASWVLSTVLGLMFKNKGGLSGFLQQLTSGGLGNLVESWLGKDEPLAVNATQVEGVIGSDIVNNLSSKLNLPSEPVGMAIAYILPKVVSALTPDGVVPDKIPAGIAHYILGDEQAATETEVRTQEQHVEHVPVSELVHEEESSGFNWWWLLLLPLFLLLGWCTLKQPEEAIVSTTPPNPVIETEPMAPVAPIPSINPSLSISNEANSFYVSGTVADDATKKSIFDTLNSMVGSDNVSGDILVDPNAKNANWLTKLSGILSYLKDVPGSRLIFDGDDITLDGTFEQGAIDGLMGKLKEVFGGGGFNINSLATGLVPTTEVLDDAVETGGNAIKNMVASGAVTGESLVSALNVAGINFATGSFNIASESMAVLRDAAEAIKAAPAGIQIQVGGHTDSTGSNQINTTLSGQRAQAVVDALVNMGVDVSILSAKGYGASQPVADNSSKEGRAQNRRMEFTLQ